MRRRNPVSPPADKEAARELFLYAENNSDLYHQQYIPIVRNLVKKFHKGTYDKEKAVKLWMYYVEANAKHYAKNHSSQVSDWKYLFNKNTRLAVAREFEEYVKTEIELGNFDGV